MSGTITSRIRSGRLIQTRTAQLPEAMLLGTAGAAPQLAPMTWEYVVPLACTSRTQIWSSVTVTPALK